MTVQLFAQRIVSSFTETTNTKIYLLKAELFPGNYYFKLPFHLFWAYKRQGRTMLKKNSRLL